MHIYRVLLLCVSIFSSSSTLISGQLANGEKLSSPIYGGDARSAAEENLREIFIHNSVYDRRRHPILYGSQSINVSMSLRLLNLMEIDEHEGCLTINAEMIFEWHDWQLRWEPSDFANLNVIPVKDTDIYHPEIILLNGINVKGRNIFAPSVAMLHADGKVQWRVRATLKTKCFVDVEFWPFTAMECDFKFGVPKHNENEVHLSLLPDFILNELQIESPKWRLVRSGQFLIPEEFSDFHRIYGKKLPWIRIFLEKKSNNFFLTFFSAPTIVLVLGGLLFSSIPDPHLNYLIGLLGIFFFSGLHFALTQIIPTSNKIPVFVLFVSCGEIFVLGCLLSIPILEFLKSRTTSAPKFLAASARLLTFREFGLKKVMTFNDANDLRVDHVGDWSAIASFFKFIFVFSLTTIFSIVIFVSFFPFLRNSSDRWTASQNNLAKFHPSF